MYSTEIFTSRIRELRTKKGLNQKELGRTVGLSFQAISDIERGYRHTTFDKLVILADYFDVSLDYLAGRTDCPQGGIKPNQTKDIKEEES